MWALICTINMLGWFRGIVTAGAGVVVVEYGRDSRSCLQTALHVATAAPISNLE